MELLKLSDDALINELHRRFRCRNIKDSKRLVLIGELIFSFHKIN